MPFRLNADQSHLFATQYPFPLIKNLTIAVLIDLCAALLPCELHARVTWAVCDGHSLPHLRDGALACFVHEVNRSSRHCRRCCHVQGLRMIGFCHGSSVLRDENCRCLSRRGGCPLDDRGCAVAHCGLSDCLGACGDGGVLGDDLLDCRCLRARG